MNFHHIGIIVKDLKLGELELKKFSNLRRVSKKIIIDKKIGVKILFLKSTHHPLIELISPLKKNSPISLTLSKNINILNHLAYTSKNLNYDIKKLKEKGLVQITPPTPAKAFKEKNVVFFLSRLNFIIELIEK